MNTISTSPIGWSLETGRFRDAILTRLDAKVVKQFKELSGSLGPTYHNIPLPQLEYRLTATPMAMILQATK